VKQCNITSVLLEDMERIAGTDLKLV